MVRGICYPKLSLTLADVVDNIVCNKAEECHYTQTKLFVITYLKIIFHSEQNVFAPPHIPVGELFVNGMHISPYDHGNIFNRDPLRPKKLLMHKREIMKLTGLISREGYTLVPLSLYFKGSYVKMAVGLCKGKKLYDKRDSIAKRESDRIIEREMKSRKGTDY